MGLIMIRGTRRAGLVQVRHVRPVRVHEAQGLVKSVYTQAERDFGMLAPPVSLHSPAPEVLAAAWLIVRETLIADGAVDRVTREVVATAVSSANACPYCVDVHSSTLHGLARGREATALAEGRLDAIADPRLRAIADWAGATGTRQGGNREVPASDPASSAELIGVALTFHYLNRMVSVFLAESPFPPGLPTAARGVVKRAFGALMRPAVRTAPVAGASLPLLPAVPVPDDLSWAAGNPAVAGAYARAAAAVDAAGERSVPGSVRELVTTRLSEWDGEPAPLNQDWITDAIRALPAVDRPAGRVALLTVEAPYRVTEADVAALRQVQPADRALVELTAWASFAAARRIGAWVRPAPAADQRPGRP